jgi:uncharacterized protein YqjF (DUF2071 family)
VDRDGRRGIVFRSLDADRLAAVLAARAALRLPYVWSRMSFSRENDPWGEVVRYETRRRGEPAASSRIVLRLGEALDQPSAFEQWLTARWALHSEWLGHTVYLSNEHEPWSLRRVEVVEAEDGLVAAAGFPGVTDRQPDSVLWSPGVDASFGPTR